MPVKVAARRLGVGVARQPRTWQILSSGSPQRTHQAVCLHGERCHQIIKASRDAG